jgi:hypothetical protein
MDVEEVFLIELDLVSVYNVEPAANSAQITSEDVTLSVVLVGKGKTGGCEERDSYFFEH